MKKILILLFSTLDLIASATDYYVSTKGNDNNPGTMAAPFATWQKAFDVVKAGDIVYIRGGTYYFSDGTKIVGAGAWNKDGTLDKPIRIYAYPGEIPLLDVSNFRNYNNYSVGIYLNNCHYWHLKGLHVRGAKQYVSTAIGYGVQISKGGNLILEEIISYDNGGTGISVTGATSTIEFINCDSYNNYDPYSSITGGNADGFGASSIQNRETLVIFRGCRSWNNSDDGFDFWRCDGSVLVDSCWAFLNGYDDGDGVGFKLGRTDAIALLKPQRTIRNSIAFKNIVGFSQNFANVNMNIFNNTSCSNTKSGFYFHTDDTGIEGIIIRNNISYRNAIHDLFDSKITHDHNSWNNDIIITDADFLSLDINQLGKTRKADGGLPEINALHLAPGSDLIDAGVDVGIPYSGRSPDLGAFENQPIIIQNPLYQGSVVENATPAKLEMNYNSTLANIVPAASAFDVRVNSTPRAVSSVSISGTKVFLNLASPVAYGNVVTVAYTKPSANPLQTSSGGQAASISAQTVSNKVAAPAAPVFSAASVENATPSRLELTYNLTLANIIPATSAFAVSVNSTSRPVTSITISGTKVYLILSSPVAYGNSVTVSYTKPSTNPLQTSAGGQAASFSAQSVTNNISAPSVPPAVPVLSTAVIENATPSRLELTYNLSLANIIPVASAFAVRVNSSSTTVSSVSISGTKVYLTLASPVVYGNIVAVSYTKPATNPVQTAAGGQAASFSTQSVVNRVAEINVAPVVVVTSPESSYSGFVNEISAVKSYDSNKDNLTFTWSSPSDVPISSTSGSAIRFLGPIVSEPTIIEFFLKVSDGKITKSETIPVEILPYKPELEAAEILTAEASSFKSPNNPYFAFDGNMSTMWSASGTDQWLIVELKDYFSIQHVKISFQPDQEFESYFDLLASYDNITWESVLTKTTSCGFSGNLHVYDFPQSLASKEFKFVKLMGLGNMINPWNYISEVKIFGYRNPNPPYYNNLSVKLFPNPARETINLRIEESSIYLDFLRIVDLSGREMYNLKINPDVREFQIPINLKEGIYIVYLGIENLILSTQKLIVN